MIEVAHGDLVLMQFERLLAESGLVHAFTTRPQNYAPHRGVGCEQAIHWRRRVCEILDVPFDQLTSPQQVHGAEVVRIDAGDIGCGRDGRQSAVRFVDGLISDRRGVSMILLSADCPLVCAYDPDRPAVGAVHSSWQGTVAGATVRMIRLMQQEFGSDPARIRSAICPSAGPCCYEVGEDVRRIARTRLPDAETLFQFRSGRLTFDLWSANHRQLTACGIPPDRIEVGGLCSICDPRFWSHRRDGTDAGRSGLLLSLR
jgi:polyphenol oxidase